MGRDFFPKPEYARRGSPTSHDDRETEGSPGLRLLPSTIEIIRSELKRQMTFQGEFIDQFFPTVRARGSVEYLDVENMSLGQAEAMSFSLARSVRHFERDARKRRGVSERAAPISEEGLADYYEIKARQYAGALRDLCRAYGLVPKV